MIKYLLSYIAIFCLVFTILKCFNIGLELSICIAYVIGGLTTTILNKI